MDIFNVRNFYRIPPKRYEIIKETEESFESVPFTETERYACIVNIFDVNKNMILQAKLPSEQVFTGFASKSAFLREIRGLLVPNSIESKYYNPSTQSTSFNPDKNSWMFNPATSNIEFFVDPASLNEEGTYYIEFHFVTDTFESTKSEKYNFIITEISSDRTEIRLNPNSSDESFINRFNRFKNYLNQEKIIPSKKGVDVSYDIVRRIIYNYLNLFYKRTNINDFVRKATVVSEELGVINLFTYLRQYYLVEEVDVIMSNIVNIIMSTSFGNEKDSLQGRLVIRILQNNPLLLLIKEYEDVPSEDNFDKVEKKIFELFKRYFTEELFKLVDVELISDLVLPEIDEVITDCQVLEQGLAPNRLPDERNVIVCNGVTYDWDVDSNTWQKRINDAHGCDIVQYNSPPLDGITSVVCDGTTYNWDFGLKDWIPEGVDTDGITTNCQDERGCLIIKQQEPPAGGYGSREECCGEIYEWDGNVWNFVGYGGDDINRDRQFE